MAANSCGSMSSCCIGLKAGPAGFPERVRPGTAGCPPGWVSGKTVPLSTFGINCASSSSKRPGGWHPGSLGVVAGFRLLLACDLRRPGVAFDYAEGDPECNRRVARSEEHTSELQSRLHLVCRLLLEKKKKKTQSIIR